MLVVFFVCIIAICFQVVGLFGAWKEHFCLSLTYAIFASLNVLMGIHSSFGPEKRWFLLLVYFVVTVVAVLFIIDLRKIKAGQVRQQVPSYKV